MRLKQKSEFIISKIKKIPIWVLLLIAIFLALSIFSVIYLKEKTVIYSYSEKSTCLRQFTFLPNIVNNTNKKSDINVENSEFIKIGNIQLFSLKTCFSIKNAPSVGKTRVDVAFFGNWFAKKTYIIEIPKPPIISQEGLSQLIPTSRPLELKISETDVIFNYQLEIGDKITSCTTKKLLIYCDIKSLHLLQDEDYVIKINRIFKGQKVATIINKNIKTLNATKVTSASITQNQVIYDNPKTITVNFDKNITDASIVLEKIEGDKRTDIGIATVYENKQASITLLNDLDRDSSYVISIDELEANDGSTLSSIYKLDFKISDGPSVSSINIGNIGAPLSRTVIITFDQSLSSAQNIANFVSVTGVSAKISVANNQVFINYVNAQPCIDIGIKIKPGLQSNFGIIQNDLWSFSTRTVCYSVVNIGYSVQGRSILAYIFGSGDQTILFTGSIHGNELSSKYLMDAWISELESNVQSIPSNKKIVVIPTLNPDGLATGRRNNSNNVDINRNFPMSDWQTDIFSPANQLIYGGGGAYPLSEPESQAIANFTLQLQPRLTMSYHGSASYVIGDPWGDSAILAATYSQLSGYQNMTGVSGAFSYPITGTYDGWLLEKHGLMSIIIELSSNNNSEFARNKAALWAMVRY